MTEPFVSVVVPTRDRLGLLRVTLTSLLAQQDVELEVVVVDDGSDVDQAEQIQRLQDRHVRILRNATSRGVAAARNQGAAAARAPWVAFCDDDDLWAPRKLITQLDAATEMGRDWVYTGAVKFEQGPLIWQVMQPPTPEQVQARLADKCIVPAGASNVMVERQTLVELGGFDEELSHLADWDLWLRLLEAGMPACAPGIHVAYRLHPGAMSLHPPGILAELATIDRRWRHLRKGQPLDPGPTLLWIAMSWLRAGRRFRAAGSYLRAVPHQPRSGLRGLVRTLHPQPPKPAHVLAGSDLAVSRFKRMEHVELPLEMRTLLDDLAADASTMNR